MFMKHGIWDTDDSGSGSGSDDASGDRGSDSGNLYYPDDKARVPSTPPPPPGMPKLDLSAVDAGPNAYGPRALDLVRRQLEASPPESPTVPPPRRFSPHPALPPIKTVASGEFSANASPNAPPRPTLDLSSLRAASPARAPGVGREISDATPPPEPVSRPRERASRVQFDDVDRMESGGYGWKPSALGDALADATPPPGEGEEKRSPGERSPPPEPGSTAYIKANRPPEPGSTAYIRAQRAAAAAAAESPRDDVSASSAGFSARTEEEEEDVGKRLSAEPSAKALRAMGSKKRIGRSNTPHPGSKYAVGAGRDLSKQTRGERRPIEGRKKKKSTCVVM
jgi:hypothetical protein